MATSYHRPTTINEALGLKKEFGNDAAYLAGGTEVNIEAAPRPKALIDLCELGLDKIEKDPRGIKIGACVTFQQLLEDPLVPWFVKNAAKLMANRNIRNCATVGGQLGSNQSCASLIPTFLAAEAIVVRASDELAVQAYLVSEPQLIVSVIVPLNARGFGVATHSRTHVDISIVGAAASVALADGKLVKPIIAIGGVAPHVVRLEAVEKALDGKEMLAEKQIEELIAGAVSPMDDLRGTAAFKRHLAAVLGQRALSRAVGHATIGVDGNGVKGGN